MRAQYSMTLHGVQSRMQQDSILGTPYRDNVPLECETMHSQTGGSPSAVRDRDMMMGVAHG